MARESRSAAVPTPTYDDIARKAYELYILRGAQPGHEVEDWLEAEKQLVMPAPKKARAVAARTKSVTPTVSSKPTTRKTRKV